MFKPNKIPLAFASDSASSWLDTKIEVSCIYLSRLFAAWLALEKRKSFTSATHTHKCLLEEKRDSFAHTLVACFARHQRDEAKKEKKKKLDKKQRVCRTLCNCLSLCVSLTTLYLSLLSTFAHTNQDQAADG